jgi:uncharacterized membrane protein YdjX (TVP38/TMEM64 family)
VTPFFRIVAGLAVAAAIIVAIVVLPLRTWAASLVDWIHGAGVLGIAVFVVAYVGAALLLLPGSALTLGAGFAYGPLWGTLLVVPTSVLAAVIAFAAARRGGRTRIVRRIERDPRFAAIDRAIGRSGFKIVGLLRLSPVFPYSVLNYALGLSGVRFRDYLWASLVGMFPGTLLYVYLGSVITSAGDLGAKPTGSPLGAWLYWLGLGCALTVVVIVTRIARRALRDELVVPSRSAELAP